MKILNEINNDDKNEIRTFMKLFKIRKEKINLSLLDLIFKQNLPIHNFKAIAEIFLKIFLNKKKIERYT